MELGCKISPVTWLHGFYMLPHDAQIASSVAYQAGEIYGMDVASGAAVQALGVQEGDHVLDLCAAPGAKLCMLAGQLGNNGTLTGVDIARHRLAACRTMLQKYGLGNSCRLFVADGTCFDLLPITQRTGSKDIMPSTNETVSEVFGEWCSRKTRRQKKREGRLQKEGDKIELLFYGNGSGVVGLTKNQLLANCSMLQRNHSADHYDKVLVDAECTHDGSLKHICKYEQWGWETLERRLLDPERMASITKLQLQLLTNGFRLLKTGGTLVYSTCSLTYDQNEGVLDKFLNLHYNAELVEITECNRAGWPCEDGKLPHTLRFNPSRSRTSGLFIAKIHKCQ
ncbi:hypothetical protein KP509_13G072700 [Ceratopteris richardii]|nr:hypothetical protein KP509_13G072700 [Ceratopteris richardii]